MKKTLFIIMIAFLMSGCITTGKSIYCKSGRIITIDDRVFEFEGAEVFRNQWITVVKQPHAIYQIANKDIKYISVASYYVKTGVHIGMPYLEKQF